MSYLVAAVLLVGLVGAFNLALVFGVIRRLRVHGEKLSRLDASPADTLLPAGAVVPPFVASTVDGRAVSRDTLADRTVVGFFTPDCEPCRERVPEFLAYAAGFPGSALAVAVGDPLETETLVAALAAADVVAEPVGGPLQSAFRVSGYPALCVVDSSGLLLAGGTVMRNLPTWSTRV